MKKSIIKSALVLMMVLLTVPILNAQPNVKNGPGSGKNNVKSSLNLSAEQQEQMKTLRLAHYKEMKPLKFSMAELKAQYRTLMAAETVDMKLLSNNIDQQTALMNKTQKLQAYQQIKVKEILTDEQEMMMAQKQFRGKKGRGPHSGFRHAPAQK